MLGSGCHPVLEAQRAVAAGLGPTGGADRWGCSGRLELSAWPPWRRAWPRPSPFVPPHSLGQRHLKALPSPQWQRGPHLRLGARRTRPHSQVSVLSCLPPQNHVTVQDLSCLLGLT